MKRSFLLRLAAILIACVAFLAVAAPALADWTWCIIDPHVTVADHHLELKAYYQEGITLAGDAEFFVAIPPDVPASVTYCDPGTQCAVIVDPSLQVGPNGAIPVRAGVLVNAQPQGAVLLTVIADGVQLAQVPGTSGALISTDIVLQ